MASQTALLLFQGATSGVARRQPLAQLLLCLHQFDAQSLVQRLGHCAATAQVLQFGDGGGLGQKLSL